MRAAQESGALGNVDKRHGMTHCDNLIEKHENSGVSQAKNEKTNTDLNVRRINIGRRGE